jgi:FlaG/FlaF family flagellin (archaellin)
VGAVFFILIVVLMVGALGTMFGTFNSFVEGQHTSNQATQLAQQQNVNVQNLTFGGSPRTTASSTQRPAR